MIQSKCGRCQANQFTKTRAARKIGGFISAIAARNEGSD